MTDPLELIPRHLRDMAPYIPVLPFEVRSRQLGLEPSRIVKLDANENPYGPHPAVAGALAELPFLHIYPDPECRDLRAALSAFHGVPEENLLVAAGADEVLDLTLRLFLEKGDAVINCPPTFDIFAHAARLKGMRVIDVPRREDFSLDVEAIEAAARAENPKLLFVASPNNPDGSRVAAEDLERLLALPLVLMLDEAYIEFAAAGSSRIREVAERPNLVVLRTFSKWGGLAGLRVGFGAFPAAVMPHLWKVKPPYNVAVPAARAALVTLEGAAERRETGRRILAERERLAAALEALPWLQPYPSEANFLLCRVDPQAGPRLSAAALRDALARRGILVRHFAKAGVESHVRVTVGRPEHTDALLAALGALTPALEGSAR